MNKQVHSVGEGTLGRTDMAGCGHFYALPPIVRSLGVCECISLSLGKHTLLQ